mgnify:CR=1 FL=1
MTMHEHTCQAANKGLMADQQQRLPSMGIQIVQSQTQVAIRSEPVDGLNYRVVSQQFAHDLRGLLGTHIGAGDNLAHPLRRQMLGALFGLFAPVWGQLALRIRPCDGFGFAMA